MGFDWLGMGCERVVRVVDTEYSLAASFLFGMECICNYIVLARFFVASSESESKCESGSESGSESESKSKYK